MRKIIHKIHYSKDLKPHVVILRMILWFCSLFYMLAVNLRNCLYSIGVLQTVKLEGKVVISIGNLTTGGTGKTPITAEIAKISAKSGKKTAILSRGYSGKLDSSKVNLVSNGKEVFFTAEEAGDEPYWLGTNIKDVFVITCKDRVKAALWAVEKFGIEIFILDDGFQYRRLERDLNILLVDGHKKFGNEQLLPAGPLREPMSEIKRADKIIVVNKIPYIAEASKNCRAYSRYLIKNYDKEVFGCNTVASDVRNVKNNMPVLEPKKVYAFTGIAQPDFFFSGVSFHRHKIVKTAEFDDHYVYTKDDLINIVNDAKNSGAEIILTTEKDIVKLRPFIEELNPDIPICVLRLAVELDIASLLKNVIEY